MMRSNKKGEIWAIAEFWSWIAMFLLILVFLLLFKFCSKPTLQQIEGQQLDALDKRQEALTLLQTPVTYRGQDVTLGYLVSLGSTVGEFDRVYADIQRTLFTTVERRNVGYGLKITYPASAVDLTPARGYVLDTVKVPSPAGETVVIQVLRSDSLEEQRAPFLTLARKGYHYVTADGRAWVYWGRGDSPLAHDSWSVEGFPCATRNNGDHRVCIDGSVPKGPDSCFVLNDAFVLGNRLNHAACEAAMAAAPTTTGPDAREMFIREVARAAIGGIATAPDGSVWTNWGRICTGGPSPDCEYWSKRDFCEGKPVVVDKLATPQQFGKCEGTADGFGAGMQLWRTFPNEFLTETELLRVRT